MISDANTAENGEYTITVTATDAAGNAGTATVSVMLDNTRSFTSMIPDGVSLFPRPVRCRRDGRRGQSEGSAWR